MAKEKQGNMIYLQYSIMQEAAKRGGTVGIVANRDLGRLYGLYQEARAELDFTIAEYSFLLELITASVSPEKAGLLWAVVADKKAEPLAVKWGINQIELARKIRSLSTVQAMAILDAAEQFWEQPEEGYSTAAGRLFGSN